MTAHHSLAQAFSRQDIASILLWLGVILTLVLAVMGVGVWARKRMLSDAQDADPDQPFTLGALRDMHRRGQLTDEEYQRARARIIATTLGESPRDEPRTEEGHDDAAAPKGDNATDDDDRSGDDPGDGEDPPQSPDPKG